MVGSVEGARDGTADGMELGDGDGSIVGEHKAGLPSGDSVNIGLFGRHSYAQHSGHPSSGGVGTTLQSGLMISELTHSAGRAALSKGRKHVAYGHRSMTSTQSEGIALGDTLGPSDTAVGESVICDGVDDA